MPKEWSNKRERQYEHIKESAQEQGKPAKTAKRIAAATVNKERARAGRGQVGQQELDQGHLVWSQRWAPLRNRSAEGPDQGTAL